MKIGIVGSRKRDCEQEIRELVNSLAPDDIVVSGGCIGPDLWAEEAAKNRGILTLVFLPVLPAKNTPLYEFTKAYYARNQEIAQAVDVLHAFVSPDRRGGTEHTIKCAKKLNKTVFIHP